MFLFFIITLSIWFNYYWLVNNEIFILSVFLISFFLLIYTFFSFLIKLYFFFKVSNIQNILKYFNVIDIYLDRVLYQNIIIKNYFLRNILKNKYKFISNLIQLSEKINNFLLLNIFNFFLNLKKSIYKLLNNKKLLLFKNDIKLCEIIL